MLGVISALPQEASCFLGRKAASGQIFQLEQTLVCVAGMGHRAAKSACERLIAQGVRALLSWGTAGALAPGLNPGDLLLPATVEYSANHLPVDFEWRERLAGQLQSRLTPRSGSLLHAHGVVAGPGHKAKLFSKTGALAVDMESAAVGEAALASGIPWVVIRAIVDPASQAIPAAVLETVDSHGKTDLLKLLAHLAHHPSEVPALLELGRNFRTASATLKYVARICGPGLCSS
jgi:adenosylhomocysteine nucleosidase